MVHNPTVFTIWLFTENVSDSCVRMFRWIQSSWGWLMSAWSSHSPQRHFCTDAALRWWESVTGAPLVSVSKDLGLTPCENQPVGNLGCGQGKVVMEKGRQS